MNRRQTGCLITSVVFGAFAILIGAAVVKVMTPRELSKEPPREVFEQFVCKPIPSSVEDIKVSGTLAFAGGGAWIEFTIDDADRAALLAAGRFTERVPKEGDPFEGEGGSLWYERKQQGMNEEYLYLQKSGKRAAFEKTDY